MLSEIAGAFGFLGVSRSLAAVLVEPTLKKDRGAVELLGLLARQCQGDGECAQKRDLGRNGSKPKQEFLFLMIPGFVH